MSDAEKLKALIEFVETLKESFANIKDAPDASARVQFFAETRVNRIEIFLKTLNQ